LIAIRLEKPEALTIICLVNQIRPEVVRWSVLSNFTLQKHNKILFILLLELKIQYCRNYVTFLFLNKFIQIGEYQLQEGSEVLGRVESFVEHIGF